MVLQADRVPFNTACNATAVQAGTFSSFLPIMHIAIMTAAVTAVAAADACCELLAPQHCQSRQHAHQECDQDDNKDAEQQAEQRAAPVCKVLFIVFVAVQHKDSPLRHGGVQLRRSCQLSPTVRDALYLEVKINTTCGGLPQQSLPYSARVLLLHHRLNIPARRCVRHMHFVLCKAQARSAHFSISIGKDTQRKQEASLAYVVLTQVNGVEVCQILLILDEA